MARKLAVKPYHHGDLQNALIAAGLQILATQGVSGLNLREVARVAGVSHTAPYRHFPDKQALITAIAFEGFELLAAAIRSSDIEAHATAVDRLVAAGGAYVRFAIDHPAHIKIMFSPDNMRATSPQLYAISKFGFEYLTVHIVRAQQAGEIGPSDAHECAKCLWSSMHGLAVLVNDGQLMPDVPDAAAQHVQALRYASQYTRAILRGFRA
jgi:AcrR family transcriptional regulator